MNWKPINFGKHRCETVLDVAFDDPDYFIWMCRQDEFKRDYGKDLAFVLRRLSKIKIPARYGPDFEVEIVRNAKSRKFESMSIVPKSRPAGSHAQRFDRINLFASATMGKYDKTGGKMLLRDFKRICFGDVKVRLTKERADAFLADDSNFHL